MMHVIDEICRLRDEHSELTDLSDVLLRLVQSSTPPPAAELTPIRVALRDGLIRHLKCEDWVLYPRLMESSDPAVIAMAQEFIAEMGHIADIFSAYSRTWMPDVIVADWPGYCAATKAILKVLSIRIARENWQLYPLAEAHAASAVATPAYARG